MSSFQLDIGPKRLRGSNEHFKKGNWLRKDMEEIEEKRRRDSSQQSFIFHMPHSLLSLLGARPMDSNKLILPCSCRKVNGHFLSSIHICRQTCFALILPWKYLCCRHYYNLHLTLPSMLLLTLVRCNTTDLVLTPSAFRHQRPTSSVSSHRAHVLRAHRYFM